MNIFRDHKPVSWKPIKKMLIECILGTDMSKHFACVEKLKDMCKRLEDEFGTEFTQWATSHLTRPATQPSQGSLNSENSINLEESEFGDGGPPWLEATFQQNDRMLLCHAIVHCADISNLARPLEGALNWSNRVLEEFWAQGDEEKKMGLPVSMGCDRSAMDTPQSIGKFELGFIDFVVCPLFIQMENIFPKMSKCSQNLSVARAH